MEVSIDTEALVGAIGDLSDPTGFIMAVDNYVADEQFTLDLIKKLAESMAREYGESSDHVTARIVEHEFGDAPGRAFPWGPEDITNYENSKVAMEAVVRIIDSLLIA